MAFNPNETPIEKAIRVFKEGKELEAVAMVSKMRLVRCVTKEELKVLQIAAEMNAGMGRLYEQMGFNKEETTKRALEIFRKTFIKDEM